MINSPFTVRCSYVAAGMPPYAFLACLLVVLVLPPLLSMRPARRGAMRTFLAAF